jgi:hypothetical protein
VVAGAEHDDAGVGDRQQVLVSVTRGVVHAALTPISGRRELTIARPSSNVSSGLGTELTTVSSPGRFRDPKSTVKSGGMRNVELPTGDVLSVKPLKYDTVTRLGRGD